MCYTIYLSTTSPEPLNELANELFRFERPTSGASALKLLDHEHSWLLLCRYGGCSCHFRHFVDRDFEPPVDWAPEDEDDVESTQAAYDLFARLVKEGHQVDLVDLWNDEVPGQVAALEVSLSEVGRDCFAFVQDRRLVIGP